ncbi:MAG TPA: 4Fe-4S binding protein [Spirochaetota bacterium]|nr:4Fe-4S binding protein [Spirochaetota bacterium]
MFVENKTIYLRREIIARIARLYFEDKIIEEIDKIPIKMIRKNDSPFRCCIYKDRELIKYRTIASLGFSLENEFEIDSNLLSDYAKLAIEREKPAFPILTFIDEACKSCVRTNYFVTNVCKNCVAKPCMVNCPKDAISISSDSNQAKIDPKKCVNCGLCMKVCPFHAIVYVPVPCEESCPVGAISKDERGKEKIDYDKCIFCGKCKNSCPFGAIMEKSQVIDVIKHIKSGKKIMQVNY